MKKLLYTTAIATVFGFYAMPSQALMNVHDREFCPEINAYYNNGFRYNLCDDLEKRGVRLVDTLRNSNDLEDHLRENLREDNQEETPGNDGGGDTGNDGGGDTGNDGGGDTGNDGGGDTGNDGGGDTGNDGGGDTGNDGGGDTGNDGGGDTGVN